MILEKFESSRALFNNELFNDEGIPLVCQLHDYFDYYSQNDNNHNCLGCNLANSLNLAFDSLSKIDEDMSVEFIYTSYLLRLYLAVERFTVVFEIIGLPRDYLARNFSVFSDIRKWANFIKHPNAFMLVHHPEYTYEGNANIDLASFALVIDQDFIKRHYSSPKHDERLWKALQNKRNIVVNFPNPEELTIRFCTAIKKFNEIIRDNPIYLEILSHRATYENFYIQENEDLIDG